MKAITITQPFATLILLGHKQYETRSYGTAWRGEMVIHAGRRTIQAEYSVRGGIVTASRFDIALQEEQFDYGAALGIVTIEDCIPVGRLSLSLMELSYGDYSSGRMAWKLKVVTLFEKPVKMPGKQGIWEINESVFQRETEA